MVAFVDEFALLGVERSGLEAVSPRPDAAKVPLLQQGVNLFRTPLQVQQNCLKTESPVFRSHGCVFSGMP